MTNSREIQHDVNELFTQRWSPRAFNEKITIDQETLFQFFEAARWAPSAWNAQPWRFIYALKDTAYWDTLFTSLSEYNQSWAKRASALILVLSKKSFVVPGQENTVVLESHSFDTGAAWANFALQASLKGWYTHAIGGYDRSTLRQYLDIPEDYQLEAIIVVGQQGDKTVLAEGLQFKENPTIRHPVHHFVAEGQFTFNEVGE
ncbi:nitroreductase family protein [Acinetobacter sp. ANC 4558]|uniref:nitroreductase family protein n=1 Tax=Acinetobacter sp. ANC 4558 TaxID=1977876 RepID=UPI000A357167|nr:nitroreductase family protein [Acinetobacter sp. ANC 4558]OTG84189.1 nitroreductase family protein [Acinetobacter sp. ANC 4558]